MTYLRFHLIFNLPLLIVLGAISGSERWTTGEMAATGWVFLAVLLFTTPWDNFAAKRGIWGFPREKYTLKIGYLPVEEYVFFLLQSANVMLAIRALFYRLPILRTELPTTLTFTTLFFVVASLVPWLIIAAQLRRVRRRAGPRVNYALHLCWFLPVIYIQWIIAPILFLSEAGLLAGVTLAFGIYYTLADLVAVRVGTWFFDENQITGVKLRGILPWEEIAFFFLTSLLVAQSYILLLPEDQR